MRMSMIKALLFDCDGVIADTMEDHAIAWIKVFRDRGHRIDKAWVYEGEGIPSRELGGILMNRLGIDCIKATLAEIAQQKEKYFYKTHHPRIYPRIDDILSLIKRHGLPCALVSGAARTALERALPGAVAAYFDVVISADDITDGKPSPEPYLMAARLLDVAPRDCLVIENAPMGIRAAKAAGMRCIALCTTLPETQLAAADLIVRNHAELGGKLDELIEAIKT